MAAIYRLNALETALLQAFLNLPRLPLARTVADAPPEQLDAALKSLTDKGYLCRTPEGLYRLDPTLGLILRTAAQAHGTFSMANPQGPVNTLAFRDDTIALLQEAGDALEAMWLPHLPMAIGFVANTLEPFLNQEASQPEQLPAQDRDRLLQHLAQEGWELCWECTGTCKNQALNRWAAIFSNGSSQLLAEETAQGYRLSRPNKAGLVNALTTIHAPIHGSAIAEGGLLHGNL